MFVCLSVGMWRANGNKKPCTDLNQILHTHTHLSKEGFGLVLTQPPHPPGPRGPETLKAELFTKQKMFSKLQINLGSAGFFSYS